MTRFVVPALFLSCIVALLSERLQTALRRWFEARPALILVTPAILSLVFCAIAAALDAFSAPITALIVVYTFVPAIYAWSVRSRIAPIWQDFLIIIWLWLPLEFNIGSQWIRRPAQPLMHITAYGISILLGLIVFLIARHLEGMKYNLPRTAGDVALALGGFGLLALVLIPLGRAFGFLEPFHLPGNLSPLRFIRDYLVILAATALPEEILFRGMIQNCITKLLGPRNLALLVAAVVFGAAHLDNGPQPIPNWRYMILATIAGFVYGKIFQRGSSIFASAFLHALTDGAKHWFF